MNRKDKIIKTLTEKIDEWFEEHWHEFEPEFDLWVGHETTSFMAVAAITALACAAESQRAAKEMGVMRDALMEDFKK